MKPDFNFTKEIPPDSTIAVGDVHGQIELLEKFVDWVRDSDARVVLLGDLIDRARNPGDDLKVLELVRRMCEDPEKWGLASFTSVQGNHERMLLNALEDSSAWVDWMCNGGDIGNMESLGEYDDWIRRLPYYVTVGDTLFSHAGVFPGNDPAKSMDSLSNREAFVWNRGSFLKVGPRFEVWSKTLKKCVFGHTPRDSMPYRVPDAVCIDTLSFKSGVLTAYNATYDTFTQFNLKP